MEEWENSRRNEIKDKDILSLQVKFWAYPQNNPHMKAKRNKIAKHLITEWKESHLGSRLASR